MQNGEQGCTPGEGVIRELGMYPDCGWADLWDSLACQLSLQTLALSLLSPCPPMPPPPTPMSH